jgi:hypothetical protein
MADKTTKTEELIAKIEKTTPSKPAAAPGTVAAAQPVVVGARHGPAPMRLSKGQRKHIRRLKQAGEFKPTDRRR